MKRWWFALVFVLLSGCASYDNVGAGVSGVGGSGGAAVNVGVGAGIAF